MTDANLSWRTPLEGRNLAKGLLGVLILAIGSLAIHARIFEAGQLHVGGMFTDQAGYITTARQWVDTGELGSGILYPAYVRDPAWRQYMPGHYACLALSFKTLGYSTFAAQLPNLIGFVLACLGGFWIANRVYGYRAGAVAAALLALFPANLNYAFTAMSELTFTAAGALALVAFLCLRPGLRPWLTPVCLALPFLFRETGSLLVLPMALMIACSGGRRGWVLAGVATLLSVLVLWGLNRWQIADGKGSVPLTWVTHGGFNYTDAFADVSKDWSAGEWLVAFGENAGRNLAEIGQRLVENPLSLRVVGLFSIVLATGCALVRGLRRRGSDPLALGAGLFGACLLLMLLFLYDVKGQKGMRNLLFTTPLLASTLAASLVGLWESRRATIEKSGRLIPVAVLVTFGLGQMLVTRQAAKAFTAPDEEVAEARQTLESIGHDPDLLLVVAFELFPLTLDYAVRHYPVPWSWVPTNEGTTQLLMRRHPMGTLIVNPDAFQGQRPPARTALGGLDYVGDAYFGGRRYFVYQKRN